MQKKFVFMMLLASLLACKKEAGTDTTASKLQFEMVFDAKQARLNNLGQPAVIPAGNAAQTPTFKAMSVHYIELAQNQFTALGKGAIVYKAPETTKGGDNAVDFDKAKVAGQNEIFATINLKDVPPGTYEWVRASVTYQNYDFLFNLNAIPNVGDMKNQKATLSSFVGFNTYITKLKPNKLELSVNDDKKQGFWALESQFTAPLDKYNNVISGEAPAGATTVVNPLAKTSPVPAGSCVVTGKFTKPLVITGTETKDVTVQLSFSVNNSFEWVDTNKNGEFDVYNDKTKGTDEKIVDMGLRGLIPIVK
jgi:hypothetical protein